MLNLLIQLMSAGVFCALERTWTYSDAFYHCVVTASTVGYGDVSITSQRTKLWASVHMIIVVALLAELLSSGHLLRERAHERERVRERENEREGGREGERERQRERETERDREGTERESNGEDLKVPAFEKRAPSRTVRWAAQKVRGPINLHEPTGW